MKMIGLIDIMTLKRIKKNFLLCFSYKKKINLFTIPFHINSKKYFRRHCVGFSFLLKK